MVKHKETISSAHISTKAELANSQQWAQLSWYPHSFDGDRDHVTAIRVKLEAAILWVKRRVGDVWNLFFYVVPKKRKIRDSLLFFIRLPEPWVSRGGPGS